MAIQEAGSVAVDSQAVGVTCALCEEVGVPLEPHYVVCAPCLEAAGIGRLLLHDHKVTPYGNTPQSQPCAQCGLPVVVFTATATGGKCIRCWSHDPAPLVSVIPLI